MAARRKNEDQLFVRDGRRSYRRRYSQTEVRIGIGVLLVLGLVAVWVVWMGRHPDPQLFTIPDALLQGEMVTADRGPLPDDLAQPGWHEGSVASFDAGNLYEKINGREDYYKSFGFEKLVCVSLIADEDASTAVDIELFDQGTAANALGAYAGERPVEISPVVEERGMHHLARNALFLARGRWYLRAIGSDESAAVLSQLRHLLAVVRDGIAGEPLPWGYALFVGALGIDPGRVSYIPENAFSFGFARNVFAALADDEQTELFVVPCASETAAAALAERFTAGFLQYGSVATNGGGATWVRDRYLGAISGARVAGRWVQGIRGAPNIEAAGAALERLAAAVSALPSVVVDEAWSGTGAPEVVSGEPVDSAPDR